VLGAVGVLTASIVLEACGGSRRGAAKAGGDRILRASITGRGEGDTRLLFKAAGLEPSGFRIDYKTFQSGAMVVEAMNGRSLDYGGMSEIPPVFAAASNIHSFRQIAVAHGDVNNQVVLVPKGSTARSIADLKGKKVGYVRATTAHYFLLGMLEQAGLGWSDIEPMALNVSDGAAAFSRGALDAWAIYGFPIQRALATEGARVLKTALGVLSGNYLVTAHVDALADPDKVEMIGDYLRLLKRAYAWGAAHQEAWAKVIAADIGVPLEYVQDQFRRKSANYELRPVTAAAIASQQDVGDVFTKAGLLPRRVDVRPLWDDRFNSIIEPKV
jgi:sulfonate transport system substrate-binding protein